MNTSASQCSSSACESGWTLYLEQSSFSKNQCQGLGGFGDEDYAERPEVEEEDLSMVSDASSGPPHYRDDCLQKLGKKSKNKKKSKDKGRSQQHPYLDDTASSPVLSKKVTMQEDSMEHAPEFSRDSSATHFKGKSAFKKHFGFFQSSFAEKSAANEAGGCQGRNRKRQTGNH